MVMMTEFPVKGSSVIKFEESGHRKQILANSRLLRVIGYRCDYLNLRFKV
jgi:hypothetical protein